MSTTVQRVGPYRVEAILGRGGMASVHKAVHARTGQPVALKVFSHSESDPQLVARFRREMQVHTDLVHPNLVHVIDAGADDEGHLYVALELFGDGTLEDRLRSDGALAVSLAIRVSLAVARALEFLHERRILHRDVKPSNVLLAEDGRVVLADLGLALAEHRTRLTRSGQILGTLPYLAPEVAREDTTSVGLDIYALGVTLHRMLTGRLPFAVPSLAEWLATVGQFRVPTLGECGVAAPPELEGLIRRMLAADPSVRPSAREVRLALEMLATDETSRATPTSQPPTRVVEGESTAGCDSDERLRLDVTWPPRPPVGAPDQAEGRAPHAILERQQRIFRKAKRSRGAVTKPLQSPAAGRKAGKDPSRPDAGDGAAGPRAGAARPHARAQAIDVAALQEALARREGGSPPADRRGRQVGPRTRSPISPDGATVDAITPLDSRQLASPSRWSVLLSPQTRVLIWVALGSALLEVLIFANWLGLP